MKNHRCLIRSLSPNYKKEYDGKITPGGGDAKALARLLAEWYPLGRKATDLETIVGTPGYRQQSDLFYAFHDRGEIKFQFVLNNEDRIVRVLLGH